MSNKKEKITFQPKIQIQWVVSDNLTVGMLRKRPNHQIPIRDYLNQLVILGKEIETKYKTTDQDSKNYPHELVTAQKTISWASEALAQIDNNDAEAVAIAMRNLLEEYIQAFENQQKGANRSKPEVKDKKIARELAMKIWAESPLLPYGEIIPQITMELSDAYTDRTIRDWIRNLAPEEVKKRGRRKK